MNLLLNKIIPEIHDHLYANSNIKHPEKISVEVSKVLHTGSYIEQIENIHPAFNRFTNIVNNELSLFNHSQPENSDNWIRSMYQKMNIEWELFPNEIIELSNVDIIFIAHKLHKIEFDKPNEDIVGDAIEIFRSYYSKILGGQFFTDQKVTELAMNLLEFNPLQGETLADLCSGTGGFLLAGINHTFKLLESEKIEGEGHLANIVINSIEGFEIDSTVASAGNNTINSRIGINSNLIQIENSLTKQVKKYDCLATNPPFGVKIKITDPDILSNYTISIVKRGNHLQNQPTPPDILFIEQNLNHLKEGGRLAIVLPYQILSGPKAYPIRKWILDHATIDAVIDLPTETFQPHTGTKTSLVVLRHKVKNSEPNQVFMATPRWIGHDRRGLPVFKINSEGITSNEILTDFPEVIKAFKDFRNGNKLNSNICFSISHKKIESDPSLRFNAKFHANYMHSNCIYHNEQIYRTIKLKDVTKSIFYPGRFKRHYVEKSEIAVPFLGGSNITEHILNIKKFLAPFDKNLDRLKVKSGWILITRSGTTGIVSTVPDAWNNYAISEHVIRIIPNLNKINPHYLVAYLHTEHAQSQIKKNIFGSVIDEISPEALGELNIPIPKDVSFLEEITTKMERYETFRNQSIQEFDNAKAVINNVLRVSP